MENKNKILDLYYNQHLKQTEISKIVGTTSMSSTFCSPPQPAHRVKIMQAASRR